jgi:hypothetical protein
VLRPRSNRLRVLPLALVLLLGLIGADGGLRVWVDDEGRTHITDDPGKIPAGTQMAGEGVALRSLWEGDVVGEPLLPEPGATSSDADRRYRALRAAMDDLERGESARAAAQLRQVLEEDPSRPEAHFVLALLEGRRGHWDAAEAHLRSFLDSAGDRFEPWQASAKRRLEQLADERRLMEVPEAEALRLVDLAHPDFVLQADSALLSAGGSGFADTVARYLGDVRSLVEQELGVVPSQPLGVVLYGQASYVRTHGHRFSFQTVGFFDGRIHVVSAAHPAGELRTLLVHEYTHALFRERAGSDRPFWLNEGFAERMERVSQQRPPLSRNERIQLRGVIDTGRWLPLRRLAPSFGGLDNGQARIAYAEATAAADWIHRHTTAASRARLLDDLGQGMPDDEALRRATGLDTAAIDAALRDEIVGHFPVPAALISAGQ